ncbi:hypothetical protein F4703DRAFT_1842721 [Phycomyces blakesleeanus]|uniref:tRNA-splicing endonuclease subunit Sen2 n=1 Tax=Phycomyces blakesleeanus (strain ATCC 8743b / DSM 1359 / FGSC 10004 / NBRC 33097 / NRRL 1555) TaxID=763407 RepID=A0A162XPY2_PHYB8|nr:hypothetical protein PHYBLDRAFT_59606 [Phycomyces blakesleeanus NRRL 1555(-)]OAD76075.1 hypothetical protein PHYBLDRAFT_59606 [Phycomyces blakesleeanus NRRL 1555(-)]|eukprot:XP_018294115.1 hypothetical protein PHYBLDRAFT_59606 [Phycomyces blakesleeanus NRRL 1555(-)]
MTDINAHKHPKTHTPSTSITPLPILLSDQASSCSSLWKEITQTIFSLFGSSPTPPRRAILMEFGRFVWLERKDHALELYDAGFFGKGSLSRSKPTWHERHSSQSENSPFLEQITVDRRKQRREKKRLDKGSLVDDRMDILHDTYSSAEILDLIEGQDIECLQLDLLEAFFLAFSLNALEICDTSQRVLSVKECWDIFGRIFACSSHDPEHSLQLPVACQPNIFNAHYAAYHYYRSLGWVPKNGAKFGVDFVLYQSGPRFRHADFAVVVLPQNETSDKTTSSRSWKWLLGVNRVCTQVKKTLVLCYVSVPQYKGDFDISLLRNCTIQQVVLKRWSAEKNRETK